MKRTIGGCSATSRIKHKDLH